MSSASVDSSSESSVNRREARRRKILANSEERMKKLLGIGSKNKDELSAQNHLAPSYEPMKTRSQLSVGRESTTPTLEVEEAESITPISNLTALVSSVHENVAPEDDIVSDNVIGNDVTRRIPGNLQHLGKESKTRNSPRSSKIYDADNDADIDIDWPQGKPHPMDRVADCGDLPDDDSINGTQPNDRTKMSRLDKTQSKMQMSQSQEELAAFGKFRQLLFLVVGLLVRLSFVFSFGHEYVQSLFNPFVALEIAVLGYQRAVGMDPGLSVRGGMWMSALMMSGIRADIIQTYKSAVGAISAMADDFTLYFFAFIILHLLLGVVY